MTSIRVALFATSFLGFMYGVLSLMGGVKTDVIAGLAVALIGITGWGICSWMEAEDSYRANKGSETGLVAHGQIVALRGLSERLHRLSARP